MRWYTVQSRREARAARRALTLIAPVTTDASSAHPSGPAAAARTVAPTPVSASDPYEPLKAAEINEQFFKSRASERWVADRMPAALAFKIGKERHWHRHVVEAAVRALAGAA